MTIFGGSVGTCSEKQIDGFQIVGANGPVQRSGAVLIARIDIHTLGNQSANHVGFAVHRGFHQVCGFRAEQGRRKQEKNSKTDERYRSIRHRHNPPDGV